MRVTGGVAGRETDAILYQEPDGEEMGTLVR